MRWLPILVCIGVAGCAWHRVQSDPKPPVILPEQFSGALTTEDTPAADAAPWWHTLGSATLNALMDRCFGDNLQLRAAWARVSLARANARVDGAGRWPSVGVTWQTEERQTFFSPLVGFGGTGAGQTFSLRTHNLDATMRFELDLWKRLSSAAKAGRLEAEASEDDWSALAMSLGAEVATTWLRWMEAESERVLLLAQKRLQEQAVEVVRLRYGEGLVDADVWRDQEARMAAIRARLEAAQARQVALRGQLAVLAGTTLDGLPALTVDALPAVPGPPALGIPAELLDARPDLRALRRRLEAADHRVNASLAQLLPSLTVTAGAGYGARRLSDLFDNLLWNIAGQIGLSLFEGGRHKAQWDAAEAGVEASAWDYGHAVVTAITDVEQHLRAEQHRARQVRHLAHQVTVARARLAETRRRYNAGLVDLGLVLTRSHETTDAELALMGAQVEHWVGRVGLYKALGGRVWGPAPAVAEEDGAA